MTENPVAERLTRPHVQALDDILGQAFPLLKDGFVRVIDYMGDDAAIAQAARVSYGSGTRSIREDAALIHYLLRHHHTTPFEMCEIKLHCKMPIFVARQWIRHRTANVNEVSARYSILGSEFYLPEQKDLAPQSKTNRQGRSADTLDDVETAIVRDAIDKISRRSYAVYEWLLNEDMGRDEHHPGIARELARMALTLNHYTEWYWKIDLHNLLHFLQLRMDKHAQYEIRIYADVIAGIVGKWCPMASYAFEDCVLNAHTFTGQQMTVLRYLLTSTCEVEDRQRNSILCDVRGNMSEVVRPESMSTRDWDEFLVMLFLPAAKPEEA